MKITRSQLKRIIKEEMQRTLLTEEIDIKNDYPNIHEHIVLPLQCEIVQAHSTIVQDRRRPHISGLLGTSR